MHPSLNARAFDISSHLIFGRTLWGESFPFLFYTGRNRLRVVLKFTSSF
jgi:hypothetical protein